MGKAGLIKGALLAAGLVASIQFSPGAEDHGAPPDENEQWQRFSQRCSSDSLRTLSTAEADFLSDGREVEDFWTAEVAGLYATKGLDPCDSIGGSGETCASKLLAVPAPAPELNLRAHDRDGCNVSDFWSADLAGPKKLIALSVASGDADEHEGWTPEDPALRTSP